MSGLIDSGYSTDAAFEFVRITGEPYRCSKGISPFRPGQRSATRRVGSHWFAQRQTIGAWLYSLDADHWKRSVHQRFLVEPLDENNRPAAGSLTLFIPQGSRDHKTFSAHVLAEEWITTFQDGKGEVSKWHKHSGNNHYFDATAMLLAAAEMAGCGLFAQRTRAATASAPTARELAAAAKR